MQCFQFANFIFLLVFNTDIMVYWGSLGKNTICVTDSRPFFWRPTQVFFIVQHEVFFIEDHIEKNK